MFTREDKAKAALIVGPPELHEAATRAALERGLHVFVEKPPAPTLAATRDLRDLSRKADRICMVGFMKRCGRAYRMARERAAREDFGGVEHLFLRYSHGATMDNAHMLHAFMTVHAFDLMRSFMGDARRIHTATNLRHGACNLSLQYETAEGTLGTLIADTGLPGVLERLEITGRGAFLVVDNVARLEIYPRSPNPWAPPMAETHAPNFALQTIDNLSLELQGYTGEIRAFVHAVKTGDPSGGATIDDAVAAMTLVEAVARQPNGTTEFNAPLTT
jgi:myo-inositol 2-dehydrogenase/D-chiro-inositol 1-dehydrogenase